MSQRSDVLLVEAMSVAMYGRRLLDYQAADIVAPIQARRADRFAHRRVLLLLPRQTTKTTSLFLLAMSRLHEFPGYHAVYAAQQGTVSTRRFTLPGGWIDAAESSPLAPRLASTRSQGREAVIHRPHRSYWMALNPRPGAARSDSLDLAVLDECQEHTHDRAAQLEGDLGPTFATRPWHQKVLAGTATDGPTWWRSQVEAARRGDPGAGHLIEIGTWPDDADPADPATWWAHHPGLRAGLTSEDFLREQYDELGPAVFAREYGNRFGDTPAAAPIPLDRWEDCTPHAGGHPVAVAFDVTPDRSRAAVVGITDRDHVTLRWHGAPGDLAANLPADLPAYALPGQSGTAGDLLRAGRTVKLLDVTAYRRSCQQLHDAVVAGDVHHAHQDDLLRAWSVAARTWHEDGGTWVLSARKSGGDITPAVAAVLVWGATRAGDALIG